MCPRVRCKGKHKRVRYKTVQPEKNARGDIGTIEGKNMSAASHRTIICGEVEGRPSTKPMFGDLQRIVAVGKRKYADLAWASFSLH